MVRLAVAPDPQLGIGVTALAPCWDADDEARNLGQAEVESASADIFLPGVVELVAIPVAVNVPAARSTTS
jgi:hypothetical protein